MRWLIIGLLLAAAGIVRGDEYSDVIKTPVGLEIREFTLPSQSARSDNEDCDQHTIKYAHGNATIRLIVDNPTGIEQPLSVDIPLERMFYSDFSREHDTHYLATRTIPPGENQAIDFSIPHFGNHSISLNAKWRFMDASRSPAEMRNRYGHGQVAVDMPRDFRPGLDGWLWEDGKSVIALSPSFKEATKILQHFYECVTNRFQYLNHSDTEVDYVRLDLDKIHDWRNLACFDSLIFTHADYENASGEFKELVNDYLAAGGKLLLADTPDKIDCSKLMDDVYAANRALRGYGVSDIYASDAEAMAYAAQLKFETPFGSIVIVLLLFAVIAGPVLIFILARKNKRIHLLWIFPAISIASSVAVAAVIVVANGVSVKVKEFACEKDVPELARKVIVKNTVYVAPFTMTEPIRCPADALVTFDSGDNRAHGDYIVSTPDAIEFTGEWAPSLWPVRTRTLQVIRTGKESAR